MVEQIIITGGGAHNPVLLSQISQRLRKPVQALSDFGWSPDSLEAEGFAYLAVRRLAELPATYPNTTGVTHPQLAGEIARPAVKKS